MVKIAKTPEEKAFYQQQQAIAGCMVHGPHGVSPAGIMPFGYPFFSGGHGIPDFSSKSSEEKEQIPLHYQTTFGSATRLSKEKKEPPVEVKKVI
jgi:hypothetical protein